MDISKLLMKEFDLKKDQVNNTIKLLDEGNTVPFIARYRKEVTGGLEDVTIRELEARLQYLRNLEDRKEEVIRLIDEQDKLTEELERDILSAETLQRIDDLYRPYRQKRRTRATMAREKGLKGLADIILNQSMTDEELMYEIDNKYIDEEKEVMNREEALAGAKDIIAEIFSDDPDIRRRVRNLFMNSGILETLAVDEEEKSVYEMYYDFKEPIKDIANHRVLAINRGEKDKMIRVSMDIPGLDIVESLIRTIVKDRNHHTAKYYEEAIDDGYKRLLFPSVEREVRNMLTEEAEEEAIKVFALNLEPLLLQAPIKDKVVLALDPGFRTGCKVAVVNEMGTLMDFATIFPTEPRNDIKGSKRQLKDFIDKYGVDIIAIGNGTASRETETVVAELLSEIDNKDIGYMIISEAGASVYSASEVAREEFPDLDVSIRGAVSIGRRLQDPLAELVKIDPKHIGVGQYQHDLNQGKLDEALGAVVEDSVNRVGVDLNTASPSLLSYVAGVSNRVATNVIDHREKIGRFKNRKQVLDVKGLGPKTFVQCAGFMRIPGGEEPLDNTAVHPESYKVAKKLVEMDYLNADLEKISQEMEVGLPTLKDIIEELERPGRDPRDEMPTPILRQDVLKIEDLKEDMVVKGTVRNVVDFGAFVDIGVTEDGLVHISNLADRFIKHPKEVVEVGDIVDVKILDIDIDKGRIGLSMKDI